MEKTKVVVAGAGFGGVSAASKISQIIPDVDLTIINNVDFHEYHPDLYELVGISRGIDDIKFSSVLKSLTDIPLKKIFPQKVSLIKAIVREVNMEKKFILAEGREYKYDFLVLSLGSETFYYGIPGAKEFSLPLKTSTDALKIRDEITRLIKTKDNDIKIIIAGGGFTGVELAGSIASFIRKKKRKSYKISLSIVEGSNNVLPGTAEQVRQGIQKQLQNLGVGLVFNSFIARVEKDKVVTQEGLEIPFDLLIWTTGIEGEGVKKIVGEKETKKQKIEVNPDLSTIDFPEVFVVGDMADIKNGDGRSIPATAWAAIGEGEIAAENIKRRIEGKKPILYHPNEPIFVVPCGPFFALAIFGSFLVSGILGWIIKRGVALKYFWSVLSPTEAIKVWILGFWVYFMNDL